MAIDRSQWSLADWFEGINVMPLKGDREVDWRVGLVQGELEHVRLFFDSSDPDVAAAYDYLIGYHRYEAPDPRAGRIVQADDDDADGLAYLVSEAVHPTLDSVHIGSVEHHEGAADRAAVSQYHLADTPNAPSHQTPREGGRYALPGRTR